MRTTNTTNLRVVTDGVPVELAPAPAPVVGSRAARLSALADEQSERVDVLAAAVEDANERAAAGFAAVLSTLGELHVQLDELAAALRAEESA